MCCYLSPQAIAATLSGNTALKELDLSWNNLRQESAAAIGRALCLNRGLESLNLAHNAFNDLPSQEVGDSLRSNGTLKVRHTPRRPKLIRSVTYMILCNTRR